MAFIRLRRNAVEPNFEIVPSAQAAAIGGPGADMAPTASTTATARGRHAAGSVGWDGPRGLADSVVTGCGPSRRGQAVRAAHGFSDDAAVTKAAGGVENPQAGAMSPAPSSDPALPATASGSEGPSRRVPSAQPSHRGHRLFLPSPRGRSITHGCDRASVAGRSREHRYADSSGDCPADGRVTIHGDRGTVIRRAVSGHTVGFDRCGECRRQ